MENIPKDKSFLSVHSFGFRKRNEIAADASKAMCKRLLHRVPTICIYWDWDWNWIVYTLDDGWRCGAVAMPCDGGE